MTLRPDGEGQRVSSVVRTLQPRLFLSTVIGARNGTLCLTRHSPTGVLWRSLCRTPLRRTARSRVCQPLLDAGSQSHHVGSDNHCGDYPGPKEIRAPSSPNFLVRPNLLAWRYARKYKCSPVGRTDGEHEQCQHDVPLSQPGGRLSISLVFVCGLGDLALKDLFRGGVIRQILVDLDFFVDKGEPTAR